jgi:transcriptional regulator of heat shock response
MFQRLKNIINDHLSDQDVDAARREKAGEVVKRKRDGTPYNHQKEVGDALRGLDRLMGEAADKLKNDKTLTPDEKAALEQLYSEASKKKTEVQQKLSEDNAEEGLKPNQSGPSPGNKSPKVTIDGGDTTKL